MFHRERFVRAACAAGVDKPRLWADRHNLVAQFKGISLQSVGLGEHPIPPDTNSLAKKYAAPGSLSDLRLTYGGKTGIRRVTKRISEARGTCMSAIGMARFQHRGPPRRSNCTRLCDTYASMVYAVNAKSQEWSKPQLAKTMTAMSRVATTPPVPLINRLSLTARQQSPPVAALYRVGA